MIFRSPVSIFALATGPGSNETNLPPTLILVHELDDARGTRGRSPLAGRSLC